MRRAGSPHGRSIVQRFARRERRTTTSSSNAKTLLQLADDKTSQELVLYQTQDEVYPDDWDFWLNEETGLIGYKDFQTPDGLLYFRALHMPGPDYANPIEFQENVKGDDDNFYINHAMMLYSRGVETPGSEMTEYLLVSKEIDEEGALVRVMAGVPVEPASLTIL